MLKAKLHAPAINKNVVSRTKLLAKLEHALDYKLTLVTAPAGYGKTTAVLDWLRTSGLPAAWVSLDSQDNDPVSFWQYVCVALEAVAGGIAQETEYVFSSQELMKAGIHINILIDRLSETPSDFLLVLDDFHLVTQPSILTGLSTLIDYMPAKMHLVLISRTEPELELARLRIKWQVQRLTEEDLRFEEEEIYRFYQARGFSLPDEDVKKIELYTEGWAAAMIAVAMFMENDSGSSNAIAALPRSSRDIEQYLMDEVIGAWSPKRRTFAMKTSILDTLFPSLCDAVTGDMSSGKMLGEISKASGFLITIDEQKQEYRYHNLFKSFLNKLLLKTVPEEVSPLHQKAGLWYREMGQIPEAIEHFIDGGIYQKAFELIEHQVDGLINKNDFGRLLAWIRRLPEEYRENSFKIAVIYALYFAEMSQFDLSRQWVDRMKALKDNYKYASSPEWSNYSRTVCLVIEANLFLREGNMEYVSLVFSAAQTDGGKYYKMPEYNDFNMSDIYFYRCPIYKVTDLVRESPEGYTTMIQNYRGLISENPGYAPLCAGEFLYEAGRLEEALPYLLKAQEEALKANCPGALVPAMVNIARMKRACGDIAGAFSVLEECGNELKGIGKPHWNYLLRAFQCRLYMDAGYAGKMQEWLLSSKLGIFTEIGRTREFELMTLARALMELNRAQDAKLLLQRLLSFTLENGRLHSRVEVLNLLALLAFKDNHARLAFKYIDESLGIGLKEGYIRSYLDEFSPMAQLLRSYVKSRGKQAHEQLTKERKVFAAGLLKQMPGNLLQTARTCDEAAVDMTEKILEQLTEQEKKVLKLVANAATNKEISEKLSISIRTVKTHTGNIYGKLGLKNRAQCIRLVRELGLL